MLCLSSLSCSMTRAAALPAGVTTFEQAFAWSDNMDPCDKSNTPAMVEAAVQIEIVTILCGRRCRRAKNVECLNEEDHAYVQCEIALALREGADEAQASRDYEAHFYT